MCLLTLRNSVVRFYLCLNITWTCAAEGKYIIIIMSEAEKLLPISRHLDGNCRRIELENFADAVNRLLSTPRSALSEINITSNILHKISTYRQTYQKK